MIDDPPTLDTETPSDAVTITWVGHATVLLDIGGYRILTDPLLTGRVAHLRRRRPLPEAATADVDVVLLSHAHMDHLHLPSLKRIAARARFVTPHGTGTLLRKAGLHNVVEVRAGEQLTMGPATIEVVPALHKHGRGPHTRVEAPPVGYIIDAGGQRSYFAGDTALFDGMADFADIDVALLPIWGWGSSLGTGHLDPVTAVHATKLIAPKLVVPIHWGTYAPEDGRRRIPLWFDNPPAQFTSELDGAGDRARLHLLQPGDALQVLA